MRNCVSGKCCLCLEEKRLQRSHLLPAALYRLIGSGTDPLHPDTLQITSGGLKKSSEQVWRHLLCAGCEDRLNKNGERWVLYNCYRGKGRFRLRDELRKRAGVSAGPDLETYTTNASVEETTKLSYFCLSVVWRASLCDWVCRGQTYKRIELGPYQEKIRKYISGEAAVPQRVEVEVELSGLKPPKLDMCLPFFHRAESSHCYSFCIPGITLTAIIGGSDSGFNSILRSPNTIFVGTVGARIAQDSQMRLMGMTPPRGCEFPLVSGTEQTK